MSDDELQKRLDELTPTQCKVLYWVCQESSNAEIAKKLGREESTVESHITQIYAKLDIAGKTDRARAQQRQPYCALLLTNVKDPETDCDKRRGTRTVPTGRPNDAGSHKTGPDNKSPKDSAGQKNEDEDSQPPDIVMPQRGSPRWLVPILALAAVLLVVVGFTLSTILGGGDSVTPIRIPTSTRGKAASAPSPIQTQISVAPTLSDVQSPAPRSVIPAGQSFSLRGLIVTAHRDLYMSRSYISVKFEVYNGSSVQRIVRWKHSSIRLEDDTGRAYRQGQENMPEYSQVWEVALAPGSSHVVSAENSISMFGMSERSYGAFVGPIPTTAKYLIFRIDEIDGMTELAWQYDVW